VLNHAEELISQLRVIGRLEDFGSGASFSRQFRGQLSEERLHWHLRRRCFVRRLKSEVLPQLPSKRQVVVPVALDNEREYRLAENDVIAWLREQPLDLRELNARIAATLRAERLAQLGTLQRLAARGKLHAALAWIHDFLASGEPLVVFARHIEVQEAVMERFPDALHLLGRDKIPERDEAVRAFQDPDGPQLIVCATRVAAQGITLTRASNVAFLELEWTPAMHDQAEDRLHRIGQRDAVTAWYLLAAGHDRRDHGPPHPPQARPHRRGDRRAHVRERRHGRRRGARAARRQALPPPAQRRLGRANRRNVGPAPCGGGKTDVRPLQGAQKPVRRSWRESLRLSVSVGGGISCVSLVGITAVPTEKYSRTCELQPWLPSTSWTPTTPSASSASASACMRSMASSRAS
jgi:hypothetical protein